MRDIAITTTQNVTIQYELASLRERALALLIDQLIIWGSLFFLLSIVGVLIGGGAFFSMLFYVFAIPIFFFYTLVSEMIMDGQTWGKKAMGVKVVKITGRQPVARDYLIRWVFRMVDIFFSLGAIAALLVHSSAKGQRLGDLVANTTVIRVRPSLRLTLRELLKLHAKSNYHPQYPGVQGFSEQDMLLIKETLDRARKYPNAAHQRAIDELTATAAQRLHLPGVPGAPAVFLQTLLKDYILLTR